MRWANDGDFLVRENTLKKSVLTVTLAKKMYLLNRETDQEAKGVLVEDWSKLVTLAPNLVLMIA